jgi:hypothetical protein
MACELVAIEDNQHRTLKPAQRDNNAGEPAEAAANIGELPTLTDQGEQQYPPARARGWFSRR